MRQIWWQLPRVRPRGDSCHPTQLEIRVDGGLSYLRVESHRIGVLRPVSQPRRSLPLGLSGAVVLGACRSQKPGDAESHDWIAAPDASWETVLATDFLMLQVIN